MNLTRTELVRLCAEAFAVLEESQILDMAESLDLQHDDVTAMFERNEEEWEELKPAPPIAAEHVGEDPTWWVSPPNDDRLVRDRYVVFDKSDDVEEWQDETIDDVARLFFYDVRVELDDDGHYFTIVRTPRGPKAKLAYDEARRGNTGVCFATEERS